MKISVITAVYNRARTLPDALYSLQAQSYSNFEHIVMDGGSDDGTLDVLRELCDARSIVTSEPDRGVYDALNKGIGKATGDVVGILHSDDLFASEDVLQLVSDQMTNSSVDGVYGDLQYVSGNDLGRVIRHWTAGSFADEKLKRGWMPPHPTIFLRREVFEAWGAYDTSYRIAADYDAILRWCSRGRIRLAYIPRVLVKMRIGGASNGSLQWILRKSWEDYRALRTNEIGGLGALAWKNLSKLGQFRSLPI